MTKTTVGLKVLAVALRRTVLSSVDIMPCSPLRNSSNVSEEHVTSIIRVEG
jgi:hypothetical protein